MRSVHLPPATAASCPTPWPAIASASSRRPTPPGLPRRCSTSGFPPTAGARGPRWPAAWASTTWARAASTGRPPTRPSPLALAPDHTFTLSHRYDRNGSYNISVTVADSEGLSDARTVSLTVNEVPPTASFSNSGPVLEGGAATVSFTGAQDPSNADSAAGFRYSYDFNNDGVFEIASSASASAGVPAALMSGGSASRVIRGRIATVADGVYREYTTTLEVDNVLPTLNANLDASLFTPAAYWVGGSFTDPGTTETYAATVDYGDGAGPEPLTLQGNRTFTLSRDYTAGVYTVTVSLSDGGASVVTAIGTVTVSEPVVVPLTAPGTDIACERGVFFNQVIAVFTPLEGTATADYFVSVDWGAGLEGGFTNVTADESGQFFVWGQQVYFADGTYDLTTTITVATLDGRLGEATVQGTATVSEPVPSMTVYDLYPAQCQSWDGTIAWISDPLPSGDLGVYSAMIDWGDGQSSSGVVGSWGEGGWLYVTASHSYQEYGEFPFQVTFQKAPPKSPIQTVAQSAVAYVSNAPLDGSGLDVAAQALSSSQVTVAWFTDSDPAGVAGQYAATIDWGDGRSGPGNVIGDPANPGRFLVTGVAQYLLAGDYTVNVQVTDPGDGIHVSTLDLQSPAHVRPAALQVTMQPIQVSLGQPFDGLVATFADPNLDGPQDVADFIATIDWGDGESSPGQIGQVDGKTFSITGSHTYGQPGPFPVHVNVDTVPIADPIVNGSFADADLTGWTRGGLLAPSMYPWWGHSDQTSVYLGDGSYRDISEADSLLWQDIQVPEGNSTLKFWTYRYSADTAGDRQEALILDTTGQVLATIWSGLAWDNDWTRTAFDLTPFAGQIVRLSFNVHLDGDGRFSYIYLDDVGITRADKSGAADGAATVTVHGSPRVVAAEVGGVFGGTFDTAERSVISRIEISFTEPVWATGADALVLYNRSTHAEVAITGAAVTGSGTSTLAWDLSGVALPDGYYTATLAAADVTGAYGNTLDGDGDGQGLPGDDYSFQFHQLIGDVTGDAKVNLADLSVWMMNYDPAGARVHTPSTGDLNGDGRADRSDLDFWRQHYNPVGLKQPKQSRPLGQQVAEREAPPTADEAAIASFLAQAETPHAAAPTGSDTVPASPETPAAPPAIEEPQTSEAEPKRVETPSRLLAAALEAVEVAAGGQPQAAMPATRPVALDVPAPGFAIASPVVSASAEARRVQPLVFTAPAPLGVPMIDVLAEATPQMRIGPVAGWGPGRPPLAPPVRLDVPVEGDLAAADVRTDLASPIGSVAMSGSLENALLGMAAIGAVVSGAPRGTRTISMRKQRR